MSVWAEFNPLKSCIIGTLPNSESIIPYTKLKNRYEKYFTEIINKSRQELDELEKVLISYDIQTHRSVQDYPFHNGTSITTPPLAVRDMYTIYGNSLYKGNYAMDWDRFSINSCDHVLNQYSFDNIYELPTNDIFFDGDYDKFDPEIDLGRPLYEPTLSLKCGNDIILSKDSANEGNELGKQLYMEWIKSINPKAKFHLLDTDGHIDSQLFLVRPGLLITSLPSECLPTFFAKWERIHVEGFGDVKEAWHKVNEHRHKKFHPIIAQWFYKFLETCTEETYFNLNSLSINEKTILFTGTYPTLFDKLEKKGITCVPVDMKATTFWDTGVHCATNEIERNGELEDYS